MYSNTRFHEVLEALSRPMVERINRQMQADRYCKRFGSYEHLLAMIYGQLSGAKSLRELESSFGAHAEHHYHLGTRGIKRSTLSDANQRRPAEFFERVLGRLMNCVQGYPKRELKELLYLIDSTPIPLKGHGYEWTEGNETPRTQGLKLHLMLEADANAPVYLNITAPNVNDIVDAQRIELESGAMYVFDKGYPSYGWWHEINGVGAYFVTRLKKNAGVSVTEVHQAEGCDVLADETITFKHKSNRAGHKNAYFGGSLRRVLVKREGKGPLVLVTNDFTRSAEAIAELYKRRWQIELFFKWVKQRLKIKRFMGRSRNAVLIQLYTALITYLLLWLYKARRGLTDSLHLIAHGLMGSLFTRLATKQHAMYRRRRLERNHYIAQHQRALPL